MKFLHFLPSLALFAVPMVTSAQYIYGDHAVFVGDTSRSEVEAALVYLDVDAPCTLLIAITVDRAGNVISANVNSDVSTCLDQEIQAQAVKAVSERKFNAVRSPKLQNGTVVWHYREREFNEFITTVEGMPDTEPVDANEPFVIVEQMPEFPGGNEAMMKYMSAQMKYPDEAVELGIGGTVFVTFVVERDGQITEVKVLRGIGSGCDEEAVRVLKGMPKWDPGKQNGMAVRTRYNLPFRFHL